MVQEGIRRAKTDSHSRPARARRLRHGPLRKPVEYHAKRTMPIADFGPEYRDGQTSNANQSQHDECKSTIRASLLVAASTPRAAAARLRLARRALEAAPKAARPGARYARSSLNGAGGQGRSNPSLSLSLDTARGHPEEAAAPKKKATPLERSSIEPGSDPTHTHTHTHTRHSWGRPGLPRISV